ncbi:MAG: hypothetical protein IKH75_05040 [Ruminococcus sp.]|nr:hypothetical protein [Ruminococcus sp.]
MKKLTCEMCGSTDMLKQDGVFVCQTCGCKYTVEEAKKMMIEGTVNVTGTVKVDNSDQINNYLEMAKSAYEADNKKEAEEYCNRIIEIDPQNSEAWLIKGKAAGWQSTLAKLRIDESVQCFSKAIDYATENEKEEIQKKAADEISHLSLALISLTCSNFAESPTDRNLELIQESATNTLNYTLQLLMKCGVAPSEYKHIAAIKMNEAAVTAYSKHILPPYQEDLYPAEWRWKDYMIGLINCEELIHIAIMFDEEDYECNITRYENLIELNKDAIKSGYWESDYYDPPEYLRSYCRSMRELGFDYVVDGNKVYTKITLDPNPKQGRIDKIEYYQERINENKELLKQKEAEEAARKKAEQQARNKEYWDEHAETKRELESEYTSLETQLKELQEQVTPYDSEIKTWNKKRKVETPAQEEKKNLEEQIAALNQQKSSLSLFKGKEKKALQAQIDELNSRLPTINESIKIEKKELNNLCDGKIKELEGAAKPLKDKIDAIEKRIKEIKKELTMDR